MPNPFLLITPDEFSAPPTPADAPPFDWTTVHQTVLKFGNPLSCKPPLVPPVISETLLAAMQRLVAILNTVRSSSLIAQKELLSEAQRLESLLPYVSEEAYDVLDALREERQAVATSHELPMISDRPPHSPLCLSPSAASPFITIESLIPSLLWRIARSSYSAMHLIEGIRVKCWQPEQGWACGMLRLVVMLEVEAPTSRWCFDLATGYPAELLLESTAIVQSDESALPIRCKAVDASDDSSCQAQHQLQAVLRQLQTNLSELTTFLQGVPIALLQPGADWQAGDLRLRFGFVFSAHVSQAQGRAEAFRYPELIEAELLEDTGGLAQHSASLGSTAANPTIASLLAQAHIAVVNPAGRSLSPTTLIRRTEAETLEHKSPQTAPQPLAQTLSQLLSQQATSDNEESQLALIVQAAITHCDRQLSALGLDLLNPMLLMDELVPKLLWSITSSTYEMMQLLGGVPAQVLQPKANWQQGTLRLLAALHLTAADVDYKLDLSTGRSLEADVVSLDVGTVVQTVQTTTAIGSQPTPIATIIEYLQQQLDETMVEYQLLKDGVAIAWLEDVEQDWQPGAMKLSVSLAFVADAL